MRQWILGLSLLLLLTACTPHLSPQVLQKDQKQLYHLLVQQQPRVNRTEAKILAKEAVLYSKKLQQTYSITTPPLVHNLLVNTGIKERGLCYQWSDDLYRHLQRFHFKTIILKPVGAHIGSYWKEHNALVALPPQHQGLHQGILLDPWRNAGKLYYQPILQDPTYHWQVRTDRCEVYSGR